MSHAVISPAKAGERTSLDEASAQRQAELRATLEQGLAEQRAALDEAWRQWRELETWVTDYSAALREAYVLVFERGATAIPEELRVLVQQAIDMVMQPYRRRERLLKEDTIAAILDVNNHLAYLLLGAVPPTPETIAAFRRTRQDFFATVERARQAVHAELTKERPPT
jgi:hypothetical protein